jgi:hypothetical protein
MDDVTALLLRQEDPAPVAPEGDVIMKALISIVCLVCSTSAFAQSDPDNDRTVISAAVSAGTLGVGPEVGVRFSDNVGIRANATFLSIDADFDSDDITYSGDLNLKSFGAMLDVYPFGGSFRISGGARVNRNRAAVRATPTGSVEVGDVTYTSAQIGTLAGRADVKEFAPALTIGFGGSKRKGFFVGTDIGVLFQGEARLRQFTATGTLANDANFRASLERERLNLQDDISKVKVYPIAQAMLGWRF